MQLEVSKEELDLLWFGLHRVKGCTATHLLISGIPSKEAGEHFIIEACDELLNKIDRLKFGLDK